MEGGNHQTLTDSLPDEPLKTAYEHHLGVLRTMSSASPWRKDAGAGLRGLLSSLQTAMNWLDHDSERNLSESPALRPGTNEHQHHRIPRWTDVPIQVFGMYSSVVLYETTAKITSGQVAKGGVMIRHLSGRPAAPSAFRPGFGVSAHGPARSG